MAEVPDDPFWTFSLAVYGRPGVAEACLALQDRHGLDVNLLLFCCWAGSRGRALDAADMARLTAVAGPWNTQVVQRLRAARRWLKTQDSVPDAQAEALKDKIKADELEAERLEQALLAVSLPVGEGVSSADRAAGNLAVYLTAAGCAAAPTDKADLAALLTACFAGLSPLEADRLVAGA